jgi:hypothetical protein
MAENASTTTPEVDEFYDDVTETFPRKEDFEDRLVAVWVTGKHGTRLSEANNKPYGWVETITMALDDGQDGTKGHGKASDGDEFLVGPAPAYAEPFQWSAEGMYSRLYPRINLRNAEGLADYRPAIGRVNRRKNAKKGFNDSWSIGKPADSDRATIRQYADQIRAMTKHVQELREAELTGEAFS